MTANIFDDSKSIVFLIEKTWVNHGSFTIYAAQPQVVGGGLQTANAFSLVKTVVAAHFDHGRAVITRCSIRHEAAHYSVPETTCELPWLFKL